jgi:acetyltransferase
MAQHRLSKLFAPQSIAVVGASEREGSLGRSLWERVHANFPDSAQRYAGRVYAVNPKHSKVFDVPAFASMKALPERVDLALIAAPAHACAQIVRDCGAAGCGYALILSHGFSGSPEADARAQELKTAAIESRVRLVGPNARGMLRPRLSLDASTMTGVEQLPLDGSLGVLSQSGAWLSVLRDFASGSAIGFSSVLALGDAIDLDFGELLDFFAFDAVTTDVLLYVEEVRNAAAFMSGVRQLARMKPVVVLKSGRADVTPKPDGTHATALAQPDPIFEAAIARAGAVRVETSMQMVSTARLLSGHHSRAHHRVAILTNGKGPGVVAADAVRRKSLSLAAISESTKAILSEKLPDYVSLRNPIDIAGDATAERYRIALEALLSDDAVDACIVLFSPQSMLAADALVDVLIDVAQNHPMRSQKTLLVVFGGAASVVRARQRCDAARIAHFLSPENAVDAIGFLEAFARNQSLLRQVPQHSVDGFVPHLPEAAKIFEHVRAEGRTRLFSHEARALLGAFGIAMVETVLVRTPTEAVAAADQIGYPVTLKVVSPDLTSKTEVGGVQLDLRNAKAVRSAAKAIFSDVKVKAAHAKVIGLEVQPHVEFRGQRELFLGIANDPTFGTTVMFGSGGLSVEQVRDVAFELPPMNDVLAANLVARTRVSRLLGAYSNVPAIDQSALSTMMLRFSALACMCPEIAALDLNPVVAHERGTVALDARIVLRPKSEVDALRARGNYSHLAIHPYPRELEERVKLKDGREVLIRPIQPEDAQREREFVARLSPETLYFRFMMPVKELSPAMIERFTQIDYARELALVAVTELDATNAAASRKSASTDTAIRAVARITPTTHPDNCEFAIVVEETMQGTGLARALMHRLIEAARERGYRSMEGAVLRDNPRMLKFCEAMGFEIEVSKDDPGERIARRSLVE